METLRYIITSFAILMALQMNAQTSETYVVKRGESFSSIASKYGISENELRMQNPNAKNCYTGMKLNIKKPSTTSSTINRNEISTTQSTATHKSSTTTQVSKNYWDTFLNYSFQDGVNYFNDGKWSKAIKEFKKVMNNSHCSPEMREACQKNIAIAKEKRREKREAFWDNLSTGLDNLSTAMADASVKLQGGGAQEQNNSSSTGASVCQPSYPKASTNSSFKIKDPNNLDAQHLKEFREKGSTEVIIYQNASGKKSRHISICHFCNGKPNTQSCLFCMGKGFTGVNFPMPCNECHQTGFHCGICNDIGYTDDIWVCDANGKLLTINGEPVHDSSNNSNYGVSTGTSSHTSSDVPQYNIDSEKKECPNCHGTGKCTYCAGRGEYRNRYNDLKYDCEECHGSGVCRICHGRRWVYKNQIINWHRY